MDNNIIVKLDERMSDDIRQWCLANNITDIEGYAAKCIEKQFTLDKYGDLNIKFGFQPLVKPVLEHEETPKEEEKTKKKRTTMKKKKDDTQQQDESVNNTSKTYNNAISDKNESSQMQIDFSTEQSQDTKVEQKPLKPTPTRKTRVLKSK